MLKEKEWKKTHYVKSNQKKAGVVILIGDEIHCKKKLSLETEDGHFIMIKV